MSKKNKGKRIETEEEIKTYIARLKYAINSGSAKMNFQRKREVDKKRNKKYTNRYTMNQLFPDKDEVDVLKKELMELTVEEYIVTVKDIRFPKRSEMRVFGKEYSGEDVYIKIRVELVDTVYANGNSSILVMSFHFSDREFKNSAFSYRKKGGENNENNKK